MIRWVPFDDINAWHLKEIAKCLCAQPSEVRLAQTDVIDSLEKACSRLFEFDGGLFIVRQDCGRLVIDIMTASIWKREELAHDLKRLAADWLCDTVKTTVFDRRLADAIVKIGGRIESYDLVLEVADHEQ